MEYVKMYTTFQRNGSFEVLFMSLKREDREWLASEIYLARSSGGYVEYPEKHASPLGTCIGLVNLAMDNDFNDEVDTIVTCIRDTDRRKTVKLPVCIAKGRGSGCIASMTRRREFLWNYRPRENQAANGEIACDKVLCVNMCDKHYWDLVQENGGKHPTTAGWDEWDAIDGLIGGIPQNRKRTVSEMTE